jgi:hypothetical protein
MDDLAVERLEMVLEQIDEDWTRVRDGEHVSGPSAEEYQTRIGRVARFVGRVVNQVRNAERLLSQADPNTHHGEDMTCVWRAATAACRKANIDLGLPADDAPDDRNAAALRQRKAHRHRTHHRIRATPRRGLRTRRPCRRVESPGSGRNTPPPPRCRS